MTSNSVCIEGFCHYDNFLFVNFYIIFYRDTVVQSNAHFQASFVPMIFNTH